MSFVVVVVISYSCGVSESSVMMYIGIMFYLLICGVGSV